MPSFVNEHLFINTPNSEDEPIEVYLNVADHVFIHTTNDQHGGGFWLTLNKEDWKELKDFVDNQFDTG